MAHKPLHDPAQSPVPDVIADTRNNTCFFTIGGSIWTFGEPNLDRAKLYVMIGTAEDHHSNPLEIAFSKFTHGGGRFISSNPVRTGCSAFADECTAIRPAMDAALLLALIRKIISPGLYDRAFLARCTNAGQLSSLNENNFEFGMFVNGPAGRAAARDSRAVLALALVVQYLGLMAERWFFFAQAHHPRNLYYQVIA